MKKLNLVALMAMSMSVSMLAGCSQAKNTIGILYPVEHAALKLAADGFVEGLVEEGLKEGSDFAVNNKNAGGDEASLQSLAKDLVVSSDMTLGLGTGASKALKSASVDAGKTNPIMFTAVTDPVGAKLVDRDENGSGYVAGASDAQPIALQLNLVKKVLPEADKIGIIYSSDEENSVVQAEQAKAIATLLGLAVSTKTVSSPAEISAAANALASEEGMDAMYIPTDNRIAANMNAIKDACNANHVLSICGEFGEVETGGHISYSFDYKMLGKATGKMAAQILKGEKEAKDLPVLYLNAEQCEIRYSSANLAGSGIELPADLVAKAKDVNA